MGIRVRIEIRPPRGRPVVETAALLNSGFESDTPELLVPVPLAEALGLYPAMPRGARLVEYETAADPIAMHTLPNAVRVCTKAEDRRSPEVRCSLVISPLQSEALLNDAAISALRIDPVDPRGNRWRFRDEETERKGVAPQRW